jgi:hypothetical protein
VAARRRVRPACPPGPPTGERPDDGKLLLTTGSVVHRLDVPGAEQNGGRYLRRIEQANALRDVLVEGAGLIVVDGGWIGLEVTAAARVCGAAVTPRNTSCVAGWQRSWICTGSGTPGRVGR